MAPPEEAVEACTGCHDEAWEAFRASPHREAFERKGFLPCVECHGSHEVRAVDVTLIGVERQASCRRCHRRGQEMADTIQELARRQEKAEAKARKARRSLEDAAPGPRSDEALESLENETRELRIAIHSLDEQRIVQATEELQRTASKILERAPEETEKDTSEWRARAVVLGATLVAAIGLIGLALWSRRKS